MNVSRKLKIALLTGIIGLFELPIPGVPSFVTTAEARVGRPLTPVSVAGVARRTVRRTAIVGGVPGAASRAIAFKVVRRLRTQFEKIVVDVQAAIPSS
jgi:hypothetical protein